MRVEVHHDDQVSTARHVIPLTPTTHPAYCMAREDANGNTNLPPTWRAPATNSGSREARAKPNRMAVAESALILRLALTPSPAAGKQPTKAVCVSSAFLPELTGIRSLNQQAPTATRTLLQRYGWRQTCLNPAQL